MVSLMMAREFGFAFNLTDKMLQEVLAIVNENRKNAHHLNTKAAMELHGTTEKNSKEDDALTSNPFHRDFECCKAREVHWDGSHAAVQVDDTADFFFALFSKNQHQLAHELDHSKYYKKFSDDARTCKHFNLHPGGSAPFARSNTVGKDSIGPRAHSSKAKQSLAVSLITHILHTAHHQKGSLKCHNLIAMRPQSVMMLLLKS